LICLSKNNLTRPISSGLLGRQAILDNGQLRRSSVTEAASFDNWNSELECTAAEVFFEKFKIERNIKSPVAGWAGWGSLSVISYQSLPVGLKQSPLKQVVERMFCKLTNCCFIISQIVIGRGSIGNWTRTQPFMQNMHVGYHTFFLVALRKVKEKSLNHLPTFKAFFIF